MKNQLSRLPVLLAVAFVTAACSGEAAALKIDEPAPAFTLSDSNGKTVNLADFKGKIVVLEWHNHDCPFVKKHYESGNIPKLHKAYPAKKVAWLTIITSAKGKQGHVTGAQANANMKKAGAGPAHVLLDDSGQVGKLYGAKTTPHMYVIDPQGVLRYQGAIDSVASTDPDDIPRAENYVAKAVDALIAGEPVAKKSTQPYGCSVKYGK
jgi:peroxiredoxin